MNYSSFLNDLPTKEKNQVLKIIDTLKIGGKSEKTIDNYVCSINRFLNFFHCKNISSLDEEDIINYLKKNYLDKSCSANTYNLNLSAIKYFYSIIFKKNLNNKLLPHAKLTKKIPATIDKDLFIKILNNESNLEHKCWLLLGYCSGLRANEVATIKIEDIVSNEHKLKVLGKRNKERFTLLPDITIKYLRKYFTVSFLQHNKKYNTNGYLFEGIDNLNNIKHINSKTISNYFISIKDKYNLDDNISFHTLRHSFASNFIKAGGDPFVLKSMLGHSSFNTTSIYIHMGRDFNNLKGVNYEQI